jgi:ribonuclease P protein subunit POP4
VKGRQIMLDNPARESQRRKELGEKKQRAKVEKERRKARAGGLGKREAKARGLWQLDKEQAK